MPDETNRVQFSPPTKDWEKALIECAKAHGLKPNHLVIHAVTVFMKNEGHLSTQTNEAG